jgi:hypothetical protein
MDQSLKDRLAQADAAGRAVDAYAAKHLPFRSMPDPEYLRLYNDWALQVQSLENAGVDENILTMFVHCPE